MLRATYGERVLTIRTMVDEGCCEELSIDGTLRAIDAGPDAVAWLKRHARILLSLPATVELTWTEVAPPDDAAGRA